MFRLQHRMACAIAILLLTAIGTFPAVAAETSLAGHWQGSVSLPSQKLAFDLDFKPGEGGVWTGDISIPAQNAKDIPLINIAVDGAAVSFEIQGIPGTPTFKGILSADRISGDFSQRGSTFPFEAARGADPAEAAREALAGYDEFVAKALQDWNVPGLAVAIVKGGEVVYAKGFGYRDVEGRQPVTADTVFSIGSSSKAFTTFVLGTLVDEGRLDWDKPVITFLPGFQLYDANATALITPRDLVTHRSGLPRHDLVWYNNNSLSRREMVEHLRYLEPNEQLRAKFQYNNLMYLTAGHLIEHLTGKTWEDNVRERIFEPLGMTNSNFSVLDSQKAPDFAQPYRERDDKIEKIPFRHIETVGPAGSINSSVNDMARWIRLHLSGGKVGDRQLINPAILADLHTPRMPSGAPPERPEILPVGYALGWFVEVYRGRPLVHHGGNIDGFSALVAMLPQDDLGMVVLTNRNGTDLPDLLVRHTADRFLKLDPIDWIGEELAKLNTGKAADKEAEAKKDTLRKPGTKPAHRLEEYAGEYEHPGSARSRSP
jgi:CubicO group peptidase (beta-lactamase class C family)